MDEKTRVSAKEVLKDINAGMSEEELMEKFDLSARGLQSLFGKLMKAGLLTQAQLDPRSSGSQGTGSGTQGSVDELTVTRVEESSPLPVSAFKKEATSHSTTGALLLKQVRKVVSIFFGVMLAWLLARFATNSWFWFLLCLSIFTALSAWVVTYTGRPKRSALAFIGIILLILNVGISMFWPSTTARTAPLLMAAESGDSAAIERLLQKGESVNTADSKGQTPLHVAAWKGRSAAVNKLVHAGANIEARESRGMTPLMSAAVSGDLATVRTLLDAGADPTAEGYDGFTIVLFQANQEKEGVGC
jgi:hypothetical protein